MFIYVKKKLDKSFLVDRHCKQMQANLVPKAFFNGAAERNSSEEAAEIRRNFGRLTYWVIISRSVNKGFKERKN